MNKAWYVIEESNDGVEWDEHIFQFFTLEEAKDKLEELKDEWEDAKQEISPPPNNWGFPNDWEFRIIEKRVVG